MPTANCSQISSFTDGGKGKFLCLVSPSSWFAWLLIYFTDTSPVPLCTVAIILYSSAKFIKLSGVPAHPCYWAPCTPSCYHPCNKCTLLYMPGRLLEIIHIKVHMITHIQSYLPMSLVIVDSTAPFGWTKKEYVLCSSSSFQAVNAIQLGNTLICTSTLKC